MALTRNMLKALGLDEEKIETIVTAHGETVDGLKSKLEGYKSEAEKVPQLEARIAELDGKEDHSGEYKEQYDTLKAEFDNYKEQVERERELEQKKDLYRSLLRKAKVDEQRIDAVLKVTDVSQLEVEDGKLKDEDELEKQVKGEWAAFIVQTEKKGAQVDNPPKPSEHDNSKADPEIAQRIRERRERLYGKTEE